MRQLKWKDLYPTIIPQDRFPVKWFELKIFIDSLYFPIVNHIQSTLHNDTL
jgi:hypothetical protein